MIRLRGFLKVFLLFLLDLEGSELNKIKKEKIQARSEIVKILPTDKAQNLIKPLTLELLIEGVNKNFSLLLAAFQDMDIAQSELLSAKGAFDGNIKANGLGVMLKVAKIRSAKEDTFM